MTIRHFSSSFTFEVAGLASPADGGWIHQLSHMDVSPPLEAVTEYERIDRRPPHGNVVNVPTVIGGIIITIEAESNLSLIGAVEFGGAER